ncbi:MAG: CoA pyrophosphatase [Flavobacteriaceae bacterium]|nr:CoA pyrophosphatase [Flavobacteriaceae bacterium]
MDFSNFIKNISLIKKAKLGGLDALLKMAPVARLNFDLDKIADRHPKSAAVMVLFYPDKDNKTHFILTERAQYKGVHSAQISFPGGKLDVKDSNLMATAFRETHEEIGVKNISLIRELTTTYIPPSNFLVTPFLGYLKSEENFTPNHEVNQIIKVELAQLLDDRNLIIKNMSTSYMKNIDVPCFKLNNYIVWGATAMVLSEIKDLLNGL